MGKFRVEITKSAHKDIEKHYKSGNKSTINKISVILKELESHPRKGSGKPEQLKYELSGYWSRRINQKDRLVYKIEDEIVSVTVVSAMGHYSDK
ncbi:Txe/YoeB family addiction module toxin [Galbibacter sp. EGI 63066]|uniref:Txe/YoeB family addiction module toxin n=1 Tax=Galbibacter sp. EGI 63066 TaxID=2993559 RepID=UPI002248F2B4|nr:Txe/YoeB family addiction module toxin [Galbibacter sp. EGI 63066]MCX2679148.1 Txe/YoeB family addiction module toxin [Galbibacter sp. EGI 63066]